MLSDLVEHYVVCLNEECAEVQKEICKILRFGDSSENIEKLFNEMRDLMSLIVIVSTELGFSESILNYSEYIKKKQDKIDTYYNIMLSNKKENTDECTTTTE
jgi:hypothetical protein